MVSRVNLKLFKTVCMLIISLMYSWVNFQCPIVWVFTCWINRNSCWMSSDLGELVLIGNWNNCLRTSNALVWGGWLTTFWVRFCLIFGVILHFLGRTHIWTLVLYYKNIVTQLSERVRNCIILWRFEDFALDHGHGTFTIAMLNNTTTIKW